jgi:hypothetical protein
MPVTERSISRPRQGSRVFLFLTWALVGPAVVFGLLDASVGGPVGLIVLALAFVGTALLSWRTDPWPEVLGAVAGCGIAAILIGYADRAYFEVCPDGEPIVEKVGDRVVSVASCPYMAPTPWLLVGSLLLVSALCAYIWARRRMRDQP